MTTHEYADKQERYVTAEGKYTAKVKAPGNGWLGTTKPKDETKKGTDFIRLPLIIEDEGDQHGREIVWQGWLTEKAAKWTCDTLDAAFGREWDIKTLAEGKAPWVGKLCRITVEAEEGEDGKMRHKIKWLNPHSAQEPISLDRISKLNDRILAARTTDGEEIPF